MSAAGDRGERRVRRRVYCETMPMDEVAKAPVLDRLRAFDLELVMAVRPGEGALCSRLMERAASAGVRVAIWPMLADREGRWASAANAPRFCAFAEELVEELSARGAPPAELLVDLEPPLATVRDVVSSAPHASGGGALRLARRSLRSLAGPALAFGELADRMRARGIEVSSAVVPLVLLDPAPRADASQDPSAFYQALLGTSADGPSWSVVSAMLYTSMIEGLSRGALRRPDALALLAAGAQAAKSRWGERAGVSLGAVSTGALGDEPIYRDPTELAEDVAVVLAAGITHLSLFDLAGVLRRSPADPWLQAFCADPAPSPEPPASTPRALVAARAAWLLGRAIGLLSAPIRSRGSW